MTHRQKRLAFPSSVLYAWPGTLAKGWETNPPLAGDKRSTALDSKVILDGDPNARYTVEEFEPSGSRAGRYTVRRRAETVLLYVSSASLVGPAVCR